MNTNGVSTFLVGDPWQDWLRFWQPLKQGAVHVLEPRSWYLGGIWRTHQVTA